MPDQPFAPAFPEFFDEKEFDPWWPSSLRGIQNAEASITDSFIRTVFGWRPQWISTDPSITPEEAINRSLYRPTVARSNFRGTLEGLQTPFGEIDLTASESGISWKFSKQKDGSERG